MEQFLSWTCEGVAAFLFRKETLSSFGRSANDKSDAIETEEIEAGEIRAGAIVANADRLESGTMRHPEAAHHVGLVERPVLHLDFLQSLAVLDHQIHHVVAAALVEHQRLHQPVRQHELSREAQTPSESEFEGAVEENGAELFA